MKLSELLMRVSNKSIIAKHTLKIGAELAETSLDNKIHFRYHQYIICLDKIFHTNFNTIRKDCRYLD